MDTKNASKWLKGPLPPLAESILTSGLISNKTVKDGSISCKVKLTESQNIKLTNQTENFPKPKLRSSSTVSSSLMMNDIPRPSRSQQSFEKIPFSNPCKTHTIEEIVENPQKHYKLKEAPIISSKHHSNIKDLTNTVIHELDSNLANLMLSNADLENTLLNQIDYKDKMIQIYNFTFNQIILQEKSIYSERALLLRRLMEFYNSLVSELDNIQKNVKLQEEFFINVTKKLESEKSEMIQLLKDKIKNEEVLQQNIELLENKNKILNDESNNKDIQISSTSYEIDFLKGQIMQLQFKIQNKKENKKLLQNAISQRDDESKKQLQQIESLTKVIEEFHQGETGYIQKYHDKCKEIEMFKLEIEKLKKEIYDFSHKERYDVAIDTEDLPKKEIKKSSIQKDSNLLPQKEATTGVTQIKSFFRPRQSLPSAMNNRDNNWNLAELMKPQQQSNEEPIIKPKINDSDSYLLQKPQKKAISRISTQQHIPSVNSLMKKRSSKEKIASLSSGVSTESLSFPTESYFDFVQKSNASIQTSPRLLETSEEKEATNSNSLNKNDIFHTSQKYIVDIDNYGMKIDKILFIQPPNYNVDHQKVSDIPDLLSIIMPFLSRPYIAKHLTDMKILDNSSVHNIVKNEKPLVWGLQLIHNFFLDPFIRANENLNRASIEVIFTDWITRQYNLQHLVNQVIADFGYLLLRNYGTSKMMAFFYEILEGRYTITQLSFISYTLFIFNAIYASMSSRRT
ncbi:hypothetical protein TRFO_33110 [Tritrichomonas foetus]|uniref:Uncharacterized protein n=1 Tax=Tritrichomonas foetus TaxID=1144522 RepID=A0A1J4JRS7_9EUKA|nr:hypothetical protein TRFO_33110 [Tritrichomonas foetus]|eukprot:OHT00238.1 hypothetical protein TRFO_33110 [Tritrichomonas foetus]